MLALLLLLAVSIVDPSAISYRSLFGSPNIVSTDTPQEEAGAALLCSAVLSCAVLCSAILTIKYFLSFFFDSQVVDVACGIGQILANKGAVGVVLKMRSGKTLALVNAHLAAHQIKVRARARV